MVLATPYEAKHLIKDALAERGFPPYRLTARTIDFTDLARAKRLFVRVHGWEPNPAWSELTVIAGQHGFSLETD